MKTSNVQNQSIYLYLILDIQLGVFEAGALIKQLLQHGKDYWVKLMEPVLTEAAKVRSL